MDTITLQKESRLRPALELLLIEGIGQKTDPMCWKSESGCHSRARKLADSDGSGAERSARRTFERGMSQNIHAMSHRNEGNAGDAMQ
jgi:hypothetical protein